ncbi:hypothetical protein [Bacillus massilinigeriensis]|uniref:hypothetical protein n=1 Tax=Bacillus massilionigeriensis TaxID=1805475 RepID=UPI0013564499|nr:hypothetical protein [Bacillus massilionigeriensis]
MTNPQSNKNQRANTGSNQNSGSEYHMEHAGQVPGYGEMDPNAKGLNDKDEKTDQYS